MSGPQYPPPPGPGSNGIGVGAIGVMQIGDIPTFNPWDAIISQYANSPSLDAVLLNVSAYFDPTYNFSNFYDFQMNVDTAQGYGLDVWGRIVGVVRTVKVQNAAWFGFVEALPGSLSFDPTVTFTYQPALGFAESGSWQTYGFGTFGLHPLWSTAGGAGGGPFYGGQGLTSNYNLTDDQFRLLILAKAMANITNGSIPAINQILMSLFPNRGNAFVTEGYQGPSFFGFEEATNCLPFGQGVFYGGEAVPSMVMTYTFDFPLSPVEIAIVSQSGVLPRSTGVSATIVING